MFWAALQNQHRHSVRDAFIGELRCDTNAFASIAMHLSGRRLSVAEPEMLTDGVGCQGVHAQPGQSDMGAVAG